MAATGAVMGQAMVAPQITGRVRDTAGVGVAGVDVRALDESTGRLLSATTDADGRFALGGREAGRFVVTAASPGYLPARYGALASGQPGVPVRIGADIEAPALDIILVRPGTIHGRVTDADGAPVSTSVRALTMRWNGQRYVLAGVAMATALSDGTYTIDGLGPGEYLVMAAPAAGVSGPPAFHPGVGSAALAARVVVTAGSAVHGVDVTLPVPATTTVTVTLRGTGDALVYPSVVLIADETGEAGLQADASPLDRPLVFDTVSAGRYTVVGTALEAVVASQSLERRWVTSTIESDGKQPLELAMDLGPGASIEGRVVQAEGASAAIETPEHWLWPFDEGRPPGLLPFAGVLSTAPGERFAISGIAPGRYVIQFGRDALAQPAGFSIDAIRMAGDDVADLPIDLRAGDRFTDVEVVVTSERTELTGTLTDAAGRPRTDVTLVAFAADSRYWWTGTRRIRLARPDTEGFYVMTGLPPGEYFLVAVAGEMPSEPADPEWLGRLTDGAAGITLPPGGRLTQDFRTGDDGGPNVTRAGGTEGASGTRASRARRR